MPSPPSRETHCVHPEPGARPLHRAVNTPIHQAATFLLDAEALEAMGGERDREALVYSRYSNPSVWSVERQLAALEGAESAVATASGLAAIANALLALSEPGDHLVACLDGYGSTTAVLHRLAGDAGRGVGLARSCEVADVVAALRPETRLVLVESLGNPLNPVADLPALAEAVHARGALLLVDATFASPVLQRPLELGADLVLHSASKYLNGHSDVIAGVAAGAASLVERIWNRTRLSGPCIDPHAAWLLQRGLKTLHLRVERACANALRLAGYLEGRAEVAAVHYPGLASHPHHARARALLPHGCGGIVSFRVHGGDPAALRLCRAVGLILEATSLGGAESLISLPFNTSHSGLSAQERESVGILPGTVRLAVGIEAPDDLEADLGQALSAACPQAAGG